MLVRVSVYSINGQMPRFSISFVDEGGITKAPQQYEAADVASARAVGLRAAGELLTEALFCGERSIAFTLCLDDERGKRLEVLPLKASAVQPPAMRMRFIYAEL